MSARGVASEPNFSCAIPLSSIQMVMDRVGDKPMPVAARTTLLANSVLDACCETACREMCVEESRCQGDDSLPTVPIVSPPQDVDPESWADLSIRSLADCAVENTATSNSEESGASTAQCQNNCPNKYFIAIAFTCMLKQVGWA